MSKTIKHPVTKGFLDRLENLRLQHKKDKQHQADFKLQLKNA
jgi:hypothetical protein